jgi:hypothetical protein
MSFVNAVCGQAYLLIGCSWQIQGLNRLANLEVAAILTACKAKSKEFLSRASSNLLGTARGAAGDLPHIPR